VLVIWKVIFFNSLSGGVESKWVYSARRLLIGLLESVSGNYDAGKFGGMKIGTGNRSTRNLLPLTGRN
jgi:hypothetical protein